VGPPTDISRRYKRPHSSLCVKMTRVLLIIIEYECTLGM